MTFDFGPAPFAILLVLLSCAWLSWLAPRYGLYLIAAATPTYLIRLTLFGIPATLLELLILLVFIIWILKDKKYRKIRLPFTKSPQINAVPRSYRLPLALLAISGGIGVIVAGGTLASLGILKAYIIEPLLLAIVAFYEIKTNRHVITVMSFFGTTVIALGGIALFQFITGFGIENPVWAAEATRRATTFYGYPNAASLFIAPVVAFFIGYAGYFSSREKVGERVFLILVLASGFIAIAAAKTTGALAALAVLLFIEGLRHKLTRSVTIALPVIFITMAIANPLNTEKMSQTFERIRSNTLDLSSSSLEIRANQWRETFALLGDRPFFGAGLAGYQEALAPYHEYDFLEIYLYPHNLVLNAWVELGMLGVIAFFWLIGRALIDMLRVVRKSISGLRKFLARGIAYSFLAILIHGMVDVPFFKNDLAVLFLMLIAIAAVLSDEQRFKIES